MKSLQIHPRLDNSQNKIKKHLQCDQRFKIIYSIAMLSVIASHLQGKGSIELNIQGWFHYNTFHMPLFMFSAGYFFKTKNVDRIFFYIVRKFRKLIFPIYVYNIFYGFFIQLLKNNGFRNRIRPFGVTILLLEPLGGSGFSPIRASWFSSLLFFVETYNVIKRKIISFLKIEFHESIYNNSFNIIKKQK